MRCLARCSWAKASVRRRLRRADCGNWLSCTPALCCHSSNHSNPQAEAAEERAASSTVEEVAAEARAAATSAAWPTDRWQTFAAPPHHRSINPAAAAQVASLRPPGSGNSRQPSPPTPLQRLVHVIAARLSSSHSSQPARRRLVHLRRLCWCVARLLVVPVPVRLLVVAVVVVVAVAVVVPRVPQALQQMKHSDVARAADESKNRVPRACSPHSRRHQPSDRSGRLGDAPAARGRPLLRGKRSKTTSRRP